MLIAATSVHRNRCWPWPNGRSSLGSRLDSAIDASRNAWLVVSAIEWAASASSAVEPLIMPPISLATAISALAASATSTVARLAPASRARSRLRLLWYRARRSVVLTRRGLPGHGHAHALDQARGQDRPRRGLEPLRHRGQARAARAVGQQRVERA